MRRFTTDELPERCPFVGVLEGKSPAQKRPACACMRGIMAWFFT